MVALDFSATTSIPRTGILTITSIFLTVYIASLVCNSLYFAFSGPLSKFPGPKSRAVSVLPWIWTHWTGNDNVDLTTLHENYGRVVRVAPNQLSFVGRSETWKAIYGFKKYGQQEAAKDPKFYGQPVNRVHGIITADIAAHSRQRKAISHAFSDKALKEQEPILKHWAQLLATKLGEQAQRQEKTDLLMMLNCTTFDIMGDLTFAEPLYMLDNSSYTPWVKAIFGGIKFGTQIRAVKLFSSVTMWLLEELLFRVPALRKTQMEHWRYTTERVDRRLAKTPDRPDFFTRILERMKGPEGISTQELYSISSTFMIAGTETTATALSGTIYHLVRNREYLISLTKEIRDSFTSVDDLTLEALARIKRLDATIKEGIRMYPPVPIGLPRVSPPGGMMVEEDFVPQGTVLAVHHLSTYRDVENFNHPFRFRPERWMGDPEFKGDILESFEPFSTGPRNCLGKNLAWHEMRLLLATILLNFDVELCKESERWTDQRVFTLWEKPALMCRLTKVA